jgi:prepilin-type N-terminal cleavage/methylation domain-containing protein
MMTNVRRSREERQMARRARSGFTLIEVMVAVTMLAIILGSLARASTVLAIRGHTVNVTAKRNAALQLEANKFGVQTLTALGTWSTGSKSFTRGDFTYTRRLTITQTTATRYTIKIVIVPALDTTRKDSVIFDRVAPTGSPLCVGC